MNFIKNFLKRISKGNLVCTKCNSNSYGKDLCSKCQRYFDHVEEKTRLDEKMKADLKRRNWIRIRDDLLEELDG